MNEMYKEKLHNPVTTETLYVLESTEEVFRIEFAIDPHSSIAAEHIHPTQQQTIHVIEGTLGCKISGVDRMLNVGESATIRPGASHLQWNPTDLPARAIEEIRPAGRAPTFFRVLFALAREGHTDRLGVPKPLIGSAFAAEFKDFVRPRSLFLRCLFTVLTPVSRALGYGRIIREYIERFEQDDIDRTPVIDFTDTPSAQFGYSAAAISHSHIVHVTNPEVQA